MITCAFDIALWLPSSASTVYMYAPAVRPPNSDAGSSFLAPPGFTGEASSISSTFLNALVNTLNLTLEQLRVT